MSDDTQPGGASQSANSELRQDKESAISQNVALMSLKVSYWRPSKADDSAARTLEQGSSATPESTRVRKLLVPRNLTKNFIRSVGALRTAFYKGTLEWETPWRAAPVAKIQELRANLDLLVADCEREWKSFVTQHYANYKSDQTWLGAMHNSSDYPDEASVLASFRVDIRINQIVPSQDFRLALPEQVLSSLKEQKKTDNTQAVSSAMQDAWDRIYDAASTMVTRLSAKKLDDDVLSSAAAVCDSLEYLNITNNEDLRTLTRGLALRLKGEDINLLKATDSVAAMRARDRLAKDANELMEKFAEMKGAI